MLSSNGRKTVGTLTAMALFGTTGAYLAGSAFAGIEHRSEQGAAHANPQAPAGAKRQDVHHRAEESLDEAKETRRAEKAVEKALRRAEERVPAHTDEPDAEQRETAKAEREAEREARKALREAEREARKALREAEHEAAMAEREARKSERKAEREARKAEHTDQGERRDGERAAARGLEKRNERAAQRGHGGR